MGACASATKSPRHTPDTTRRQAAEETRPSNRGLGRFYHRSPSGVGGRIQPDLVRDACHLLGDLEHYKIRRSPSSLGESSLSVEQSVVPITDTEYPEFAARRHKIHSSTGTVDSRLSADLPSPVGSDYFREFDSPLSCDTASFRTCSAIPDTPDSLYARSEVSESTRILQQDPISLLGSSEQVTLETDSSSTRLVGSYRVDRPTASPDRQTPGHDQHRDPEVTPNCQYPGEVTVQTNSTVRQNLPLETYPVSGPAVPASLAVSPPVDLQTREVELETKPLSSPEGDLQPQSEPRLNADLPSPVSGKEKESLPLVETAAASPKFEPSDTPDRYCGSEKEAGLEQIQREDALNSHLLPVCKLELTDRPILRLPLHPEEGVHTTSISQSFKPGEAPNSTGTTKNQEYQQTNETHSLAEISEAVEQHGVIGEDTACSQEARPCSTSQLGSASLNTEEPPSHHYIDTLHASGGSTPALVEFPVAATEPAVVLCETQTASSHVQVNKFVHQPAAPSDAQVNIDPAHQPLDGTDLTEPSKSVSEPSTVPEETQALESNSPTGSKYCDQLETNTVADTAQTEPSRPVGEHTFVREQTQTVQEIEREDHEQSPSPNTHTGRDTACAGSSGSGIEPNIAEKPVEPKPQPVSDSASTKPCEFEIESKIVSEETQTVECVAPVEPELCQQPETHRVCDTADTKPSEFVIEPNIVLEKTRTVECLAPVEPKPWQQPETRQVSDAADTKPGESVIKRNIVSEKTRTVESVPPVESEPCQQPVSETDFTKLGESEIEANIVLEETQAVPSLPPVEHKSWKQTETHTPETTPSESEIEPNIVSEETKAVESIPPVETEPCQQPETHTVSDTTETKPSEPGIEPTIVSEKTKTVESIPPVEPKPCQQPETHTISSTADTKPSESVIEPNIVSEKKQIVDSFLPVEPTPCQQPVSETTFTKLGESGIESNIVSEETKAVESIPPVETEPCQQTETHTVSDTADSKPCESELEPNIVSKQAQAVPLSAPPISSSEATLSDTHLGHNIREVADTPDQVEDQQCSSAVQDNSEPHKASSAMSVETTSGGDDMSKYRGDIWSLASSQSDSLPDEMKQFLGDCSTDDCAPAPIESCEREAGKDTQEAGDAKTQDGLAPPISQPPPHITELTPAKPITSASFDLTEEMQHLFRAFNMKSETPASTKVVEAESEAAEASKAPVRIAKPKTGILGSSSITHLDDDVTEEMGRLLDNYKKHRIVKPEEEKEEAVVEEVEEQVEQAEPEQVAAADFNREEVQKVIEDLENQKALLNDMEKTLDEYTRYKERKKARRAKLRGEVQAEESAPMVEKPVEETVANASPVPENQQQQAETEKAAETQQPQKQTQNQQKQNQQKSNQQKQNQQKQNQQKKQQKQKKKRQQQQKSGAVTKSNQQQSDDVVQGSSGHHHHHQQQQQQQQQQQETEVLEKTLTQSAPPCDSHEKLQDEQCDQVKDAAAAVPTPEEPQHEHAHTAEEVEQCHVEERGTPTETSREPLQPEKDESIRRTAESLEQSKPATPPGDAEPNQIRSISDKGKPSQSETECLERANVERTLDEPKQAQPVQEVRNSSNTERHDVSIDAVTNQQARVSSGDAIVPPSSGSEEIRPLPDQSDTTAPVSGAVSTEAGLIASKTPEKGQSVVTETPVRDLTVINRPPEKEQSNVAQHISPEECTSVSSVPTGDVAVLLAADSQATPKQPTTAAALPVAVDATAAESVDKAAPVIAETVTDVIPKVSAIISEEQSGVTSQDSTPAVHSSPDSAQLPVAESSVSELKREGATPDVASELAHRHDHLANKQQQQQQQQQQPGIAADQSAEQAVPAPSPLSDIELNLSKNTEKLLEELRIQREQLRQEEEEAARRKEEEQLQAGDKSAKITACYKKLVLLQGNMARMQVQMTSLNSTMRATSDALDEVVDEVMQHLQT